MISENVIISLHVTKTKLVIILVYRTQLVSSFSAPKYTVHNILYALYPGCKCIYALSKSDCIYCARVCSYTHAHNRRPISVSERKIYSPWPRTRNHFNAARWIRANILKVHITHPECNDPKIRITFIIRRLPFFHINRY